MKKFLVPIAPLAVVAAFALAPSSALACTSGAGGVGPCTWPGWSSNATTSHTDNAGSPDYYVKTGAACTNGIICPGDVTSNGKGDSTYCVNPGASDTNCTGAIVPSGIIYTTGYIADGSTCVTGCGHGDGTHNTTNTCAGGPSLIGGIYIGTDTSGTSGTDVGECM